MGRHERVAQARASLQSPTWWRDAVDRMMRQAAQTALPVLATMAATGVLDQRALATAGVAVAGSALLSLVKSVAGVRAQADQPLWVRYVDRAGAAFAGTLVGYLGADTVPSLADVDWRTALIASATSALMSGLSFYLSPPTTEPGVGIAAAGR